MTETATRSDTGARPRRGLPRARRARERAATEKSRRPARTGRWSSFAKRARGQAGDVARAIRGQWLSVTAPVRRVVNPLGWVLLVVVLVAVAAGFTRGWLEARTLGLMAALCLVLAAVWTLGRMAFAAEIDLAKTRVTVGESAMGRVIVRNLGGRSMLPTRFDLPVGGGIGSFQVPGLAGDAIHEQLFTIPARHRSVLTIGPVRVV